MAKLPVRRGTKGPWWLANQFGNPAAQLWRIFETSPLRCEAFQSQVTDSLERKIIDWMVVHSGAPGVGYAAIMRFLAENPDWPEASVLRKRAERALNRDRMPAAQVLAHFARQPPETGEGKLALARAHLEGGDRAQAAVWAARAWRDHDWRKAGEVALLREFDPLLTPRTTTSDSPASSLPKTSKLRGAPPGSSPQTMSG